MSDKNKDKQKDETPVPAGTTREEMEANERRIHDPESVPHWGPKTVTEEENNEGQGSESISTED